MPTKPHHNLACLGEPAGVELCSGGPGESPPIRVQANRSRPTHAAAGAGSATRVGGPAGGGEGAAWARTRAASRSAAARNRSRRRLPSCNSSCPCRSLSRGRKPLSMSSLQALLRTVSPAPHRKPRSSVMSPGSPCGPHGIGGLPGLEPRGLPAFAHRLVESTAGADLGVLGHRSPDQLDPVGIDQLSSSTQLTNSPWLPRNPAGGHSKDPARALGQPGCSTGASEAKWPGRPRRCRRWMRCRRRSPPRPSQADVRWAAMWESVRGRSAGPVMGRHDNADVDLLAQPQISPCG